QELGHVEGQSFVLERRWVQGRIEKLDGQARELVALKVDLVVAVGNAAAHAARRATATLPIVVILGSRLVEEGLAASLARPGGNVTGLVLTDRELIGKHLALVKEIAPTTSRIGVLFNPNVASSRAALPELQSAAQAMNVRLQPREVTRPEEV